MLETTRLHANRKLIFAIISRESKQQLTIINVSYVDMKAVPFKWHEVCFHV